MWRNLDLLSEPEAFPGWISTIARREAWRTSRRRSRIAEQERRVASDPAGGGLPWQSPPPDKASERAERVALLRHAVDRLDERCRALLAMLFWEEPPPAYEEVAERLGMPLGSLGPTRGRCLEKLRERLEEVGL